MSWLSDLVYQHRELESPQSFWFWSGLVTISAVVKDNVWIDRGGVYKLYPNIYVILHAESGLKKGPPIALAQRLVKTVNSTNVISGRASIQGIMKKLSEARTTPGGKIQTKSVGFICASELAASLVQDPAALGILTDLYDRHYRAEDYESLLKMETFKLKDPTLSLLGGINDAHAEEFFTNKDIQGGFLARTFVVYESKPNNVNSLVERVQNPPNDEALSKHLKELVKLTGKFEDLVDENNKPTPVGAFYKEWYHEFTANREGVKDPTGTLNRFGDSVLKIAMLLSLARSTELKISISDMEQAIAVGDKLIGNITKTTLGRLGSSNTGTLKALLLKKLLECEGYTTSRLTLMRDLYMHYSNADEFDGILQSFQAAGFLTVDTNGSQVMVTMVKKEAEKLKNLLQGKQK